MYKKPRIATMALSVSVNFTQTSTSGQHRLCDNSSPTDKTKPKASNMESV
jgi:hypothetical protein